MRSKELLRGLAETWKSQQRLSYSTVWTHVGKVTQSVETSITALISEGVLTRDGESFVPDRERLALGMGLFIRESLLSLPEGAQPGKLKDILEPYADDDEKVRWLRAAVATSVLVGDADKHPGMVDCLLGTWLSSRNFSQNDLDDAKSLSTALVEPMLRLVSTDSVNSNILLMAQAMIETEMPRHKEVIAAAIRRWFRLVPTDTFFHDKDEGRKETERVAHAASETSLRDLDLRLTAPEAGRSIRARHRLGLSVICTHASVIEPIDLLALVVARGVTHWNLDNGEQFAIRLLLANVPCSWFENEVTSLEQISDVSRPGFLRALLEHSERSDLVELKLRLPARQRLEWPERLSHAELRALDGKQDDKDILRTARRAGTLALDPACPRPPRAWRLKLAKAASERFGDSPKLHNGRGRTLDDLDLENVEHALAAWAPEAGARIVRSFLADIPWRIAAGEESWSWALEENATLLTKHDCRLLLGLILTTPAKENGFQHALRRGYLCVMAAEVRSERLRLLLNHPFGDFEWTEFYEVLALSGDERLHKQTVAVVRAEQDPCRLKRARYFLANQGGWEASPTDLSKLISDSSKEERDATDTLLRRSRIPATTSASALGPLVHVANSLSKEAWQYVAFLDNKRNPRTLGAKWIAWARSAVLTARHNGAKGRDDDAVVARGIQRLAVRIEHRLTEPASLYSDQFPEGIADEISDSAFDRFVGRLLESGDRRRVHTGVLIPVVRRALKTRHPAAKELWALAYPFQRSRVSVNERIVVQGLDWTLVDIHDQADDNSLAHELLRDLISDCRSDSELISVAMGARTESLVRLTAVVNQLLDDGDETDRARARFTAGWMPEDAALRERLITPDPSRWVERIGKTAIHRLNCESWAREWLRRFLAEKRRPHRWAAGRLFLACSDAATPFWADDIIQESQAPSSRRAEAVMLLRRIHKNVDDSELRDKFLGYSVRELSEVVPPWHNPLGWENIDVTPAEHHMMQE